MKVELKIITTTNPYDIDNYPSSGIFLNKRNDGFDDELFFVDKNSSISIFIASGSVLDSINFIEDKEEVIATEDKKKVVTEDLFLKTLSLVVNKEETYKQ